MQTEDSGCPGITSLGFVFPSNRQLGNETASFAGTGVIQRGAEIFSAAPGILKRKGADTWVETAGKRYKPKVGDCVVGLVEDKVGDYYILNIFGGSSCMMSRLAFDGATKRNKPELNRGDVVYSRVTLANADCDTELTCMALSGPKKDWSTGEAVSAIIALGTLCTF
jgi:exosome complex RNA-binding protein Rrp4